MTRCRSSEGIESRSNDRTQHIHQFPNRGPSVPLDENGRLRRSSAIFQLGRPTSSTTPANAMRCTTLAVLFVLAATWRAPQPVRGYRVLAVATVAGRSHWNFMSAVLRALTDAGHEVTAFTQFPDGDRENYTEVDTSREFPAKLDLDVAYMMEAFGRPVAALGAFTAINLAYCDMVLGNRRLAETMARGRRARFDVVVAEPLMVDCLSHVAAALHAPIIYAIPSPIFSHAERAFTGHYPNPACVSHMLSSNAVPGTFAQRTANAALLAYSVLVTGYDKWVARLAAPRPYYRSPAVSPSVIFLNSHYVTDAPRPVTANRVDVGGIHLRPPDGVPKELLEFIENSPHGVIYFSFGSTINMSTLPDHVESAFKKALARVPQRVLWRRGEEMKDKPENVMVQKWFPQRELLLHPKVKLFISHGGISGLYEAVDGGVPVLGFPLFYDQPRNMGHLVHNGMAISMDLLSVTENTVLNAIEELVNNDQFKKNAMIASERFKDRPLSPQQSVVYWTEYVVRHRGAPHLKSHALNLTWYQYLLLDVIAALLLFVSLAGFVCYKCYQLICKKARNLLFCKTKIKVQ